MSVIRLGRGNKIYCSKQVTQERRLLAHWRCPLSQKVHNKPDASPLLPMAAMEQADRNTVRPQSRADLNISLQRIASLSYLDAIEPTLPIKRVKSLYIRSKWHPIMTKHNSGETLTASRRGRIFTVWLNMDLIHCESTSSMLDIQPYRCVR
jgi:hypothetical protein